MTKQCICPNCGKIADIRRAKTGQKLRYIHCKTGCYGGYNSRKDHKKWEELEQDNIGKWGEKPSGQSPAEPAQATETSADFVPEKDDLPEVLEAEAPAVSGEAPEAAQPAAENTPDEKPEGFPLVAKIGLGALSVLGFGFALRVLRQRQGL